MMKVSVGGRTGAAPQDVGGGVLIAASVAIVIVFPVLLLVFLVAMQRLDTFVDKAGPAKPERGIRSPAALHPAPAPATAVQVAAPAPAAAVERSGDRLSA